MVEHTELCDEESMQQVKTTTLDVLKDIIHMLESSTIPERDDLLADAQSLLVEVDRLEI